MIKEILRFVYNHSPSSLKNIIDQHRKQMKNLKILTNDYGQSKSIKKGCCLDSLGKPIPWYTYPAIEYLSHLDLTQMTVFEFGSGNSTLWWAEKAKSIVSVEDNEDWYNKLSNSIGFSAEKIRYMLKKQKEEYVNAYTGNIHDIVIIDGKYRSGCTDRVLSYCRDSMVMLIFDNADWYPRTIINLRESLGWLQMDFHGFGPINDYTWTTSIFINPAKLSQLEYLAPLKSIAGMDINADDE